MLKKSKLTIVFLISLLALLGCVNNQVKPDIIFDDASDHSLVVVGSAGDRKYMLIFSRYNPDNLQLELGAFQKGNEFLQHRSESLQYHVLKFEPGTYVFQSVVYRDGATQVQGCLGSGTLMFEVKRGEILHLGAIYFYPKNRTDQFGYAGSIPAYAKSALSYYPNIRGDIVEAQMAPATFLNGKDLLGVRMKCGGISYN